MLDSIFILLFVVAFVIWILSLFEKSIIFNMISLMMWLTLMLNSLYIEIPYHVALSNTTAIINITTGAHVYNEYGISALCLGFIFVNLVTLFILYMDWKESHLYS